MQTRSGNIQRTLVALHDDPDAGADTLVDELERE